MVYYIFSEEEKNNSKNNFISWLKLLNLNDLTNEERDKKFAVAILNCLIYHKLKLIITNTYSDQLSHAERRFEAYHFPFVYWRAVYTISKLWIWNVLYNRYTEIVLIWKDSSLICTRSWSIFEALHSNKFSRGAKTLCVIFP